MIRFIGRFVLLCVGVGLIRHADTAPWWVDVAMTLGGLFLIEWLEREHQRASS